MKKLIFLICIAALVTQFAAAQSQFLDPQSGTNGSTYGQFGRDIDTFFSVTDWNDLGISKWFGFLEMNQIGVDDTDGWKGGLALKFEKIYLGFYYYGTFLEGETPYTKETTHDETGTTITGVTDTDFRAHPAGYGLERANHNYGVLLGIGNHGLKFTMQNKMTTIDIPIVTGRGTYINLPSGTFGVYDGADYNPPAEDINYSYHSRESEITPKLYWGSAVDIELGKFTTRPSASVALNVSIDELRYSNFTDSSGNSIQTNYENDYSKNFLSPIIGFDTGAISFFSGDWGTLSFGASEEFGVKISGVGDSTSPDNSTPSVPTGNKDGKGFGTLPWRNVITPYAVFSYDAADYFRLGARLSIPVAFGGVGDDNYFSIGATETDYNIDGGVSGLEGNPTLEVGFQLNGSFYDSIVGKSTILSKVAINFGIKVNFPSFTNIGTYTVDTSTDGTIIYTNEKTKSWNKPDEYIQEISTGLSFFITDNAILDAGVIFSGGNASFRTTISVKH